MQHKLWNKRIADYTLADYTKVSLIWTVIGTVAVVVPLTVLSKMEDRKLRRYSGQLTVTDDE